MKNGRSVWGKALPRGRGISVIYIDHFNARGMRRVYGRGDLFGRGLTFNMDVWLMRSGRLLARFWSHGNEIDWQSMVVIGFSHAPPSKNTKREMNEDWVPQCLRDEYDKWIIAQF